MSITHPVVIYSFYHRYAAMDAPGKLYHTYRNFPFLVPIHSSMLPHVCSHVGARKIVLSTFPECSFSPGLLPREDISKKCAFYLDLS